ncbi:hypothetical protein J3E72DRAFT_271740 [Bipolaris maydis]|uniref:uncharacterized protein n=1 Tax=Cochliobolus heterostrophus TaxID=5016 RepID=UPI0024D0F2A7|nr:hypothetical protein J3E73DRAFT_258791 [Bipolaris maydis]KAJ6194337.1 hypothetical protein J3E72DRAFT_271740 [Bipolaris maydis]KAJ6266089.1 hypothetical protein PSV08DRAFT_251831 [Bipolaris maydis]
MHTMRAIALFAVSVAAFQTNLEGYLVEPAPVRAVAARDEGCSKLPKLCTDTVLLHGGQTILTYLCPETQGPTATVTITSTTTRTVTGSATHSPSSGQAGLSVFACDELTTTMTVQSTTQVTVTEKVIRASTATTPSILPPPAIITATFTAIPLSELRPPFPIKPTWSEFKNVSTTSSPAATGMREPPVFNLTSPVINFTSFDLFPTHAPTNSSSTIYIPSTTPVVSVTYYPHSPTNSTSSGIGYNVPSLNVIRQAGSTTTVTTTASGIITTETDMANESGVSFVMTTSKGMAGENGVSFVALFLGMVATALMF